MVADSGTPPAASIHSARASTKMPKPPMHSALTPAARERIAAPSPSTASERA